MVDVNLAVRVLRRFLDFATSGAGDPDQIAQQENASPRWLHRENRPAIRANTSTGSDSDDSATSTLTTMDKRAKRSMGTITGVAARPSARPCVLVNSY
jgi:hypothetical protein